MVVVGAAVSDGRLMLLVVVVVVTAVVDVVVDVVAVGQLAGIQADHSSLKQISCKAEH